MGNVQDPVQAVLFIKTLQPTKKFSLEQARDLRAIHE